MARGKLMRHFEKVEVDVEPQGNPAHKLEGLGALLGRAADSKWPTGREDALE